nr:restriction endonuclease subunit S [Pseudomonas alcaligenes]
MNNDAAVGPQGEGMDSPSSFLKYPAYKDSGVEWLGEVPEHWDLHKLKYIARFSGGGTPSRENLAYWNGDIPWVSPKDMKVEVILGAEESITAEGLQNSTTSLVSPGGILIVVRSGILKHTIPVAINNVEVALNQDMKALRFNPEVALFDFFLRWVQGFNNQLLHVWLKQGATVESIEQEYLSDTTVPMPDIDEQRVIVDFLDHETARIDALIEEQQRLIELLKEKRQAVISHAVTKGLDPTVPMKDSGVEWLGEVPAHWQVKRLKHLVPSITVGIVVEPSKYYVDDGVPALRSLNVKPGAVVAENLVYLSEESNELHAKSKIFEGDIVAVRSGQPGTAAIVPLEFNGANCIDLIVIRKPLQGCSTFIFWYLNSDAALKQFSEGSSGAIQQHFNIAAASEMLFAWPPASEQLEINCHLDRACHQLDRLISVAGESKSLLLERRSALISAAVTGKIDVRGSQPPVSTQAPEPAEAEAH